MLVLLVALRLGGVRTRHNVKGYRTHDDVKGCRTHRSYVRPLLCAHDGILRRRIVILGIEVGLRLLVALYHLEAGVIIRDNSWRIPRSASSRIRELISLSNVHCEIVHWVGSDFKGAGCVTRPASEISLEDSGPTHLGCMLGLMSAEQIRQNLRSPF